MGDIFKIKGLFSKIIDDALEVVKWFNNHSRALGILNAVQLKISSKVKSLVLPILTRWTSHYLSVRRLLELEMAFKEMLVNSLEDLKICAGNRLDMKRKATETLAILLRFDFWHNLDMYVVVSFPIEAFFLTLLITRVKRHLEPLAVAANATQSDFARLDVVLVTLVNLYHKFCDPLLDEAVCEVVRSSLEKRWAKADQEVFILAVVLNPSLRVSCFAPGSPYRQFPKLWACVRKIFRRFYGEEPNGDFRRAFHDYVQCVGEWSNENMGLNQHQDQAKRDVSEIFNFG